MKEKRKNDCRAIVTIFHKMHKRLGFLKGHKGKSEVVIQRYYEIY